MKTIDEILNKYSRTDEGDGFYAEDVYKAMEEYASLKVAESKQLPINNVTKIKVQDIALEWFLTANKKGIIFEAGWIKIFEAGFRKGLSFSSPEKQEECPNCDICNQPPTN